MQINVAQAHQDADDALYSLAPADEDGWLGFSSEEFRTAFRTRSKASEKCHRDFYDAINGDGARVLELIKEYAPDAL